MSKKVSEDIQRLLKTVVDECDKEDKSVRERQIRMWRRLKLFWEGTQNVYWSEIAHDWRVFEQSTDDQAAYDKPINIFRAYLESIIAALSVVVPPVKCYPDDADNTLDLATAKAGDKIIQLVSRHNDVSLLYVHALFLYCTEGMVACYTYPKEDEKYGTYEEKKYKDENETHELSACPNCGHTINDSVTQPNSSLSNNISQLNMDVENENESDKEDEFQPEQELCPACMNLVNPQITKQDFVVTRLVGITKKPKSRICMEAYGGTNVKIPNYAKKQSQCPYLIYSYEDHYANALERFEDLHENIDLLKQIQAGSYNEYDAWARLSPQYQGEYPINVVTIKQAWIRPASYNILNDKDDIEKLRKKFPDGAKVSYVNDQFAEVCNESLDDCWTITYNPLSDYLHHDPVGMLLTSVQEIINDLISLRIQTIEHGIGQTFADPAVLNFKAYEQTEVTPGGIFPATPKSGKGMNEGFHELRTATLSAEVAPFAQEIQSMGQLVSGATPSIFGGQLSGVGGETASGYSMSRAQAMQRLQNTWKIFIVWWKTIYGKVVPMYIKEAKDDEHDVQQDKDGNFINVFIRKAELEGKIGKIELEANENLPLTWNQTKDIIMNLMQGQNPLIQAFLSSPENLPILREAIGLTDFYVPGEDDREKQYDEIKLLLNSEPIPSSDGNEESSIPIDPDYDNHAIEFEICRKWAVSEAGRQAKTDNQNGYRNVLLHGKMHQQERQKASVKPPEAPRVSINYGFKGPDLIDPQVREILDRVEQLPPSQPESTGGNVPQEKPSQASLKNAPIQGEENVATVS